MRKMTFFIPVTALFLSAVLMVTSVAYANSKNSAEKKQADAPYPGTEQKTEGTVQHTVIADGYVLKEYDGQLAVFRENSSQPYLLLDMQVDMLPEADRELMRNGGITVKNESELNQLVEDYTS